MYKLVTSMIVIFFLHVSPLFVPFSSTEQHLSIETERFFDTHLESSNENLSTIIIDELASSEKDPFLDKQLRIPFLKEQLAATKPTLIKPTKFAALTFDDGPSEYTPQVLEILKKHNVPATFFVLGSEAKKYPQLIRQMQAEGHVVGNHTWGHKDLTRASTAEVKREIESTNQLLEKILGQEVQLFRPPFGSLNANVRQSVQEQGLRPILWNVDPVDWNVKNTSPIVQRVKAGIKNQSLILLHDGGGPREKTVESLPLIIRQMQQDGFEFVTVPEYLALIEQPST